MKKGIFIVLLLMIIFLVGCTKKESSNYEESMDSVEDKEGIYEKISVEEAKNIIDNSQYDVILDVRSLEEYNEGHIENAILIPSNELKDKAETILVDKDAVILVYCRSGRRSASAAKELIHMGYTKVYDFGGIIDWPYEIMK